MFNAQVGHGVFADNLSVGVSCTGDGESFMKMGIARFVMTYQFKTSKSYYYAFRRISANVEINSMNPTEAISEALTTMTQRVGGDGGAIALSPDGAAGVSWNSEQMSWAYGNEGKLNYGVNPGENFEEDI